MKPIHRAPIEVLIPFLGVNLQLAKIMILIAGVNEKEFLLLCDRMQAAAIPGSEAEMKMFVDDVRKTMGLLQSILPELRAHVTAANQRMDLIMGPGPTPQ